MVDGPAGGELAFEGELLVGREVAGAGGLGADELLSRHHARFRVSDDGRLAVEDLGSRNGTAVNGRRIDGPTSLEVGDQVRLGGTTIRVEHIDRPAPPPVAPPPPAPPEPAPAPATVSMPTIRGAKPPEAPSWLGAPGPRPRRRSTKVVLPVIVLIAVVAAAVGGYEVGHRRTKKAATTAGVLGTVYVESNIAHPGANSIIAYSYRDGGNLQPLQIAEYPTGGAGSADLTDSGVLDADQHIIVSPDNKLLFAVNQGSDSIAVFGIDRVGGLTPVPGSPFPSGGEAPASMGLSGNRLVVVNKAQDGVRDLSMDQPNYTTFIVHDDGSLTASGSSVSAPAGFSPTQALISPDGNVVISSEEGGPFRAFTLAQDGKLAPGPNSPLSPPDSIFPPNFPANQKWALGLGAHPNQKVMYAQMATIAQMAIYTYDASARLSFVKVVPNPGAMLPCWTLISSDGTRIYTDNAGNNTMSVYDNLDPLNPRQIQLLTLKGDGNPWDLHLDPTGRFIFMVDPRARMNVKAGDGNQVHTLLVAPDGRLSEPGYSPVSIPVALDVNPIGLAVVPRG